jgi:cysteine desulfurase
MKSGRTYLDWNATAPLRAEARAVVVAALDLVGNPSSPHAEGRRARRLIEDARESVAGLVGAGPSEVVFTSGGTEANNAVFAGNWATVFVAGIEHDSVLAPARGCGARIVELPVSDTGVVLADRAAQLMAGASKAGPALLSLQLANNETGVVQPVAEIAALAREHGVLVHTDAVQAVGRVPVDMRALGVDFLTLSAHKIGGPKGVGALVIRDGVNLPAFVRGGGQERRRRAGTEVVAVIAGFGAAAEAAERDLSAMARVASLRDRLEAEVVRLAPEAVIIGAKADRLPNTSNIALPGTAAETLVIAFDLGGIAISAGAACSSGKVGTSHVLQAMGIEPGVAGAAIRVSLGWSSTKADVARFVETWAQTALRRRERAVA